MQRESRHAMAGDRQQLLDTAGGQELPDALVLWIGIGIMGENLRDRLPIVSLKGVLECAVILEQRFPLATENRELGGYGRGEAGEPPYSTLDQRPYQRKTLRLDGHVDPSKRYLGYGAKRVDRCKPFAQIGLALIGEGQRNQGKGVLQGKA